MKKTVLLIMLAVTMVCCLALSACTPEETPPVTQRTVTGTVCSDLGAIENAEVSVRSTDGRAVTDADGKFEIKLSAENSSEAQYTLAVKKEGCLDKTATVSADDFKDGVADVSITLLSEKLTLKGTVKNGQTPVGGVTVKVSCEKTSAVTDEQGKYTLTIDRPAEKFKISFVKDYYTSEEKTVSDFAVTEYTLDVNLSEANYSVTGSVGHYFEGALEGVSVRVKDAEYTAVTDKNGSFSITGIKNVNLPYTLVLDKSGYQPLEVEVTEDGAEIEAELVSEKINLGNLSPSNKNYSMQTVRDGKGIYFYFTSAEKFVTGNKICIYIDVNETGRATAGSTVLEFALEGSDAGQGICVIWNQKTNESATAHATINWGTEVKYNLINDETEGSRIEAFISYETFAKLGEDFRIDKNSVVGLSFFDRSAGANGAAGWDRPDLPGADNNAWVHPDNPKDFVRLAPENVIYEADSNGYVPYGQYKINFSVEDGDGNALEGVSVNMTFPASVEGATDANGKAVHVLEGAKFAHTPVFTVRLHGYEEQTVTVERSLFTDKIAEVKVTLVKAVQSVLDEKGTVTDYCGALGGVEIKVEGYESLGSVTTDSDGAYDLTELGVDLGGSSVYTLILTKEGYRPQRAVITVGTPFGAIYMRTNGDLGKFGRRQWNTRISRDDTKLTVDLASASNWYGNKDAEGNATATENEMQIYFVKDLNAKVKTAEGLFELTIVEKASAGNADWAGWRNGIRDFLAWPEGVVFEIVNGENGCRIHIEAAYAVLGIGADDVIGLGLGEWCGTAVPSWTCPFYDGAEQSFVTGGWAIDVNNPSTCLHWAPDSTTSVVPV